LHLTSQGWEVAPDPLRACLFRAKAQSTQRRTDKTENEVSKTLVDAALKVHRALGPGLLESVYEIVLAHELRSRGLRVLRQVSVPVRYNNILFDEAFRADLVVEQKVIVEVKSVELVKRVHNKQVLTYLRLADMRLGLLINFGTDLIRDGITRLVNGLEE